MKIGTIGTVTVTVAIHHLLDQGRLQAMIESVPMAARAGQSRFLHNNKLGKDTNDRVLLLERGASPGRFCAEASCATPPLE